MRQFVLRILKKFKSVGGALTGLGLLRSTWRRGEDLSFALDLRRAAGSHMSDAITILSSQYFGYGLIVVGIAYMVVVKSPKIEAQQYQILTVIGWSVFGVCAAMMLSVAMFGYFFSSINAERHLHQDQKARMRIELPKVADKIGKLTVWIVNGQYAAEEMEYAGEFLNLFAELGVLNEDLHPEHRGVRYAHPVYSSDPKSHGLLIGVTDKNSPPESGRLFYSVLLNSGLKASFMDADNIGGDFSLIVDRPP
jgi:hypothetical protein